MRSHGLKMLVVLVAIACGAEALAQGVQTSTLTGRVSLNDGSAVPGVTVSVASEALQGTRLATTDLNGVFSIRALPPGQYEATFELDGLTTVRRTADLPLGVTVALDTTMAITPVQETVVVTGQTPPALAATVTSTNLRQTEAVVLPVGRQPFEIASLAPGVTENTPNASQLSIAGGFAYDNVFLVDGVDVNDNVLGKADTLFIEEAIDETQVLTSGISAEYGRFSGGVVNVVTQSGGNVFSGAFRASLGNPAWTVETPYEQERDIERTSKLSTYYEGTLGGPILKDKLWFFGATRIERSETESVYAETQQPYTSSTDNTRFQAKLTGTLRPGQTLQGTYIENRTALAQPALPFSIDPATYGHPRTPNRLFGVNYKGVIGSRVLGEVRYSRKTFHIRDVGGTASAIVDSPFLTRTGPRYQYNAPYFDATDPENRDNQQLAGSLSFFLSTPDFGTHDIKAGGEWFRSTRVGGNSPTSTGYVFWADLARDADGALAFDADGRLIPTFTPFSTLMFTYMPQRGAQIDIDTTSLYLADHWTAGRHWTFDLGVRYEHARSEATGGIAGAKTDVIVPRLGASYDVNGDGRTVVQATWAHYAGKHNDVQFSRNSNVGNSDAIVGIYVGPPGEGRAFAPGFSPSAYFTVDGNFPTANVSFADDLHAPITREFTAAIGQAIGQKGFVKAVYVWRRMNDFIEDFVTTETGTTEIIRDGVNFGTFDNAVYQNSDLPTRRYQALELRSNYRFAANFSVHGNWTIQLENDGNFEGEGPNTPAISSIIGNYPEIFVESRNYPSGRLSSFQRHKVRLWAVYTMGLGQFGSLDVAPLYRFDSGLTYSLLAGGVPLSAEQLANDPGYANLGGTRQVVYFGERGGQSFDGSHLVDLAVTYQVPVWRSVRPWIELEVFNLFNNQKLVTWDVTVAADPDGRFDQYGLPLDYIEGPNFGEAVSPSNYARPLAGIDGGRTFLFAFGMRF